MPAYKEGSEVEVTYETNFGNEKKVAGEVLYSYDRGNDGTDWTCVVIQHPTDDRVIFASRGYKFVRSIRDWDGRVNSCKSDGRKVGEFISMRKYRTVDGDLPAERCQPTPETPDHSAAWNRALKNDTIPFDESMTLYDGDIVVYDDRRGCDVWCVVLPFEVEDGLIPCTIIGAGGEEDDSNYIKYHGDEDGYIHSNEIGDHLEEDMAIAPCAISRIVREDKDKRGSVVFENGEIRA